MTKMLAHCKRKYMVLYDTERCGTVVYDWLQVTFRPLKKLESPKCALKEALK